MERRRRPEEPVQEYTAVIKRLVSKAFTYMDAAEEEETLRHFKNGLSIELQKAIHLTQPQGLVEAVREVNRQDKFLRRLEEDQVSNTPVVLANTDINGEMRSVIKEEIVAALKIGAVKERDYSSFKCYFCEKQWYINQDCWKYKASQNVQEDNSYGKALNSKGLE